MERLSIMIEDAYIFHYDNRIKTAYRQIDIYIYIYHSSFPQGNLA